MVKDDLRRRVADAPVATYADVPLNDSGAIQSRGAFDLDRAPRSDRVITLDAWTFTVRADSRVVVARGGRDRTYKDAYASSLRRTEEALDVLSATGVEQLALAGVEDDHLTWWLSSKGLVIRLTALAPLPMPIVSATATVTDADGNIVPSAPAPEPGWHESFRYFRLSQTSEDLFDAFRNAYLSLEAVLSTIAPQKAKPSGRVTEGEGEWFRRALAEADKFAPLGPFVPGSADPLGDLFRQLYEDIRSGLSHAKKGRPVLLPRSQADRSRVLASLQLLTQVYLALAEAVLGTPFRHGGWSSYAFASMAGAVLSGVKVYASDDETPFNADDTSPNPGGGLLAELPELGPIDVRRPFLATRKATARAPALAALPLYPKDHRSR